MRWIGPTVYRNARLRFADADGAMIRNILAGFSSPGDDVYSTYACCGGERRALRWRVCACARRIRCSSITDNIWISIRKNAARRARDTAVRSSSSRTTVFRERLATKIVEVGSGGASSTPAHTRSSYGTRNIPWAGRREGRMAEGRNAKAHVPRPFRAPNQKTKTSHEEKTRRRGGAQEQKAVQARQERIASRRRDSRDRNGDKELEQAMASLASIRSALHNDPRPASALMWLSATHASVGELQTLSDRVV